MSDQQLSNDAINSVAALALKSRQPNAEVKKAPGEPKDKYHIYLPGQKPETVQVESLICDELTTVYSFREYLSHVSAGQVFVSPERIVWLSDDRRRMAFCKLNYTHQWRVLNSLRQYKGMSQREFIRLLRVDLAGCLSGSNLLPLVRQLKFTSAGAVSGNIQHGNENMGRDVMAAVAGQDAIPEEVNLTVSLYDYYANPCQVRCAVELVPADQQLGLTVLPNQLELALDLTLSAIVETIDYDPTHIGKPAPEQHPLAPN